MEELGKQQGSPRSLRVAYAFAGLLGLLLLAWAAAWAFGPGVVQRLIQEQGSAALGREVLVGRVEVHPWRLAVTLSDLRVAAADAAAPPSLQLKEAVIDVALQSLWRRAPVIDELRVKEPVLRVARLAEGRYDLDDVLARLTDQPSDPQQPAASFAIYNVSLEAGRVEFDDRPLRAAHVLSDIRLGVPFLSNLPTQREVHIEPRLAFRVGQTAFDSAADATPFAQTRKGEAQIKLSELDLQPYLGYWPAQVPLRPSAGRLHVDLRLGFEEAERPRVKVSGQVALMGWALQTRRSAPLLSWDALLIDLADLRPLERYAKLGSIQWRGPRVELRRAADGRLQWMDLLAPAAPERVKPAADAPQPWRVELAELQVEAGDIHWTDATLQPAARLQWSDLRLTGKGLSADPKAPLLLDAQASWVGGGPLVLEVRGTQSEGTASFSLSRQPLSSAGPYLRQWLTPELHGLATLRGALSWRAGARAEPAIGLRIPELGLERVALGSAKAPLAGWQSLVVHDVRVDPDRQQIEVGRVRWRGPHAAVSRDAEGSWMAQRWLAPAASRPAPVQPASEAKPAGSPWRVQLREFQMDGAQLTWSDRSLRKPVEFGVEGLEFQARQLAWPPAAPSDGGGRVSRATPPASPFQLAGRVRAGNEVGRVQLKGHWRGAPQTLEADLDLAGLPLHTFEFYAGDRLNGDLLHAIGSARGRLDLAQVLGGWSWRWTGDAALEDLRSQTLAYAANGTPPEEWLSWKALGLRGLQASGAPGQPLKLELRETEVSDFFARVILSETGRLNLQDLVRPAPHAVGADATPEVRSPASVPASGASPPAAAPAADIRIGPVRMVNGRVRFSDRFIKPNYSADLTELNGRLGGFSSAEPQALAELDLRGRAEGTAALQVSGRLNPLATPVALDIKGQVRDLELSPLTPYAVKYAGHGIERGKLSMDVAYEVAPDGQLKASNRLVLNQLRFGDAVPGAPNSLPVRLAVALLADRNGVIDIDLPISGSLNDPQFSLGPVIWKVVVNLVVKAITSPFSLLASLGAGGEEAGVVRFEPGQATLLPAAQAQLDKLAQALSQRPGLQVTVTGVAQSEGERRAAARERLQDWVRAEKRRAQTLSGQSSATPASGSTPSTPVSATEYATLLREVYRRSDIAKPRNLVGMAKDLPVSEMESLLLASIQVRDEDLRDLAQRRGLAVRDHLLAKGIESARLFLGASKLDAVAEAGGPRVDLGVGTR